MQGSLSLAAVASMLAVAAAFTTPSLSPSLHRASHRAHSVAPSLRSPAGRSLRTMPWKKTPMQMGIFDAIKESVGIAPVGIDPKTSPENQQMVSTYMARASKINDLEDAYEALSDEELKAKTDEFRAKLDGGATMDDILEEAFAVVREASWRVLKLRHYDVQLVGGMALHDGLLAEMNTGEGKTLVASLASYLNALTGKGVHVVTVNDYLARRDSENIGQIHKFLGLTVGLIQAGQKPDERRRNYECDITYVTNSELGFDFLRDNLAMTPDEMVLGRPLNMCIVDEADSIMIDEARTPLIISEKTEAPVAKYANSAKIAAVLEEKVHYTVDEKSQSVVLTERGFGDVEKILNVEDLFNPKDPWSPYIINALKAKSLFKREVQYVKKGNEILIVDEFTGRVLEGRRWSNGLHQSVEAKEGISPSAETQTIASVTYQSFFRQFPKLSGMSGTAATEAAEFKDIYDLGVICIPTALPVARRDNADVTFRTQQGKWEAVMGDIARRHTKGQPILIGTTSIQASEQLHELLDKFEVPHELLNAKPENVDRESEIVAQAGRAFAITISTNMAGRGTDILLGGNAGFFAKKKVMQKLAPALVSKQNGLPPKDRMEIQTNPACVPLPDLSEGTQELIEKAAADAKAKVGSCPNMLEVEAMLAQAAESGPLEDGSHLVAIREAYQAAKAEFDKQCSGEKEDVMDLGGLHVIGTERHESRRIDAQLRGRSGRQGDPGSSRFFLALDDPIFRMFGGNSIDGLLKTLRVEENMPLEAKSVADSLDKVQQGVEEYFYGIRKEMFKYDEIVATQREALYTLRRNLVLADENDMSDSLEEYCLETVGEIAPNYLGKADPDLQGLMAKVKQFFEGIELDEATLAQGDDATKVAYLKTQARECLLRKEGGLDAVKDHFAFEIERYLTLTQVDNLWKQHLKDMDYLKQFVGLRSYKQIDPFEEYQQEGYELFQDMLAAVRRNTVYSFFQYKLQDETNKQKAKAGGKKKKKTKSKK
mmetsp:Transcript_26866/g.62213  ORF Transcript_26866/g.62213 Transcript_26866/m.62213 type:complete len:997 (+) Transcript_26866:53-3043(+)